MENENSHDGTLPHSQTSFHISSHIPGVGSGNVTITMARCHGSTLVDPVHDKLHSSHQVSHPCGQRFQGGVGLQVVGQHYMLVTNGDGESQNAGKRNGTCSRSTKVKLAYRGCGVVIMHNSCCLSS